MSASELYLMHLPASQPPGGGENKGGVLHASATAAKLFPMPISTLGGWHPDAHRAMGTIAVSIASRTLSSLHCARATLFQRHGALLLANNAVCLMSGFDFEV